MSQIPLLERLKERKLVQWALAYLAGAWLILQVLGELNDAYDWPPAVMRSVPVLLGIGLLVALVLAWYHGEKGQQRATGPELLMLAALLVIAGAAVTFVGRSGDPERQAVTVTPALSPPPAEQGSIAVLPFTNLSESRENEYFSDGITETILTNLAKLSDLKVISRTSVMQYKDTRKPLRQIGQELGVAHVLEGSVQRAGDRVRITAQLINARTDEHLWAESYDRELRDIFQIQSEIAEKIVAALHTELSPADRTRLATAPTQDPEAYKLYLMGRFFWNKRSDDALREAIGYFQKAIERDTTFALAYASLADVYDVLPFYGPAPAREMFAKARAAATRALAIDPSLGEAHTALAWALWHEWRTEEAGREFRRAIELSPNYATAHQWYALYLAGIGQTEAALRAMLRAHELDPLSLIITAEVGLIYIYARDYERATQWIDRAIAMDPTFGFAWQMRYRTQMLAGRYREAIATLRTAPSLGPIPAMAGLPTMADSLERAYQAGGRRAFYEAMVEMGRRSAPPTIQAGLHAALGQRDEAFRLLEQALAEGDPFAPGGLQEPELDPLRGDPRFERLIRAAQRR